MSQEDSLDSPGAGSGFVDPERYDGLELIGDRWTELRAEALGALPSMPFMTDNRSEKGTWALLPLRPEEDDIGVFPKHRLRAYRELTPLTVGVVESAVSPEAYAYSALAPGASIQGHRHHRPRVTASLCLFGGGESDIDVAGERRTFVDGEWLVFDYRAEHSVRNRGKEFRIVLMILLPLIGH
jgi:quercetin dioxygenase-like cupin family protein